MKPVRLRTVLLAALFTFAAGRITRWEPTTMADENVTFFYLPFEYETYVPVTVGSIEKDAICVIRLASSSAEAHIISRLLEEAPPGEFGDKVVRLKVTGLPSSPVFADRDGGVLRPSNSRAKLSRDAFGQLRDMLNTLGRSQGCIPQS
jgi:hypothetical protein